MQTSNESGVLASYENISIPAIQKPRKRQEETKGAHRQAREYPAYNSNCRDYPNNL